MNTKEIINPFIAGTAKGLVSQIPLAGPIICGIYDEVVSSSYRKRIEGWLTYLDGRLEQLECSYVCPLDHAVLIDKIRNNELFVSCFLQTSQYVIRDHHEDKKVLFANALLKTIDPNDLAEDRILVFIELVNRYTISHLRLLYFLDDPQTRAIEKGIDCSKYYMGSIETVLRDVHPDLISTDNFHHLLLKDLYNNGLVTTEKFGGTMTAAGMLASRTTDIGKDFIRFVY